MRTLAYKVLTEEGLSPHRRHPYKLPSGDKPGEWMETAVPGFHAYREYPFWEGYHGQPVYEIEFAKRPRYAGLGGHVAGLRARLLRHVPYTFEPTVVRHGERICEDCGRPHALYAIGPKHQSWADPTDFHPYYSESWEALARRLMVENEALKAPA